MFICVGLAGSLMNKLGTEIIVCPYLYPSNSILNKNYDATVKTSVWKAIYLYFWKENNYLTATIIRCGGLFISPWSRHQVDRKFNQVFP